LAWSSTGLRCLVRVDSEVFAVHDECTHESVPLSEGDVEDGTIECWRHGSRFDLRTGAVLNPLDRSGHGCCLLTL